MKRIKNSNIILFKWRWNRQYKRESIINMFFIFLLFSIINNCKVFGENINNHNNYIQRTTPMQPTSDKTLQKTNNLNNIINNNHNNFTSSSSSSLTVDQKILNNTNIKHDNVTRSSNIRIGNELWDDLITNCYTKPTFSCLQKNVYTYLDNTLDIKDGNLTNRLFFYKNQVDYTKYTREKNIPKKLYKNNDDNNNNGDSNYDDIDNNIVSEKFRSAESPIEEVTTGLYGKTIKFAMTHDYEIKLPEILFDGATFRLSPRSIEGTGAIVKLELIPKKEKEARGKLFKKKIQHFLKHKILLSFLAIILIIKLIKIKLIWLLPIVIGVGAAKKFLLKILLFIFPALSHIFKLCHYYHSTYHSTKYHHHHHLINHHHTVSPPWVSDHDNHHYTVSLPHGPELIFTQPPKAHPVDYLHSTHSTPYHGYDSDWELSGPGLGSEYISDGINRNSQVENAHFKPKYQEDANDIQNWGLGNIMVPSTHIPGTSHNVNPFLTEQQSSMNHKMRPYGTGPIYVAPSKRTTPTIVPAAPIQYEPQISQHIIHRTQAQVKEALRIQAEQKLIAQQQKILQQQPFIQDNNPLMPKGYDPFYSPILAKMDKTFLQLGFSDDYCKERLVCSMYKKPNRYSPHSNFISAELSRDTSELQKPKDTNPSVIKFYRLVQAARDGQEQQDCLRLYPQCSINTE